MVDRFYRRLISVEIRLGFLFVPSYGREFMPQNHGKIKIRSDGEEKEVTYNAEYQRIFGLTAWYRKHNVKPGQYINIERIGPALFELTMGEPTNSATAVEKEASEETSQIDLSGLSSQAKGDIVEDRIKELVLIHGQGLLNVYKPVIDTEGIDLIVVRNGQFHPMFIQVKGRFNLHANRSLIIDVKTKTFNPHVNYYVVGAFFNQKTLELDENLLFIPSKELVKQAIKVNENQSYRVVASLDPSKKGKWGEYLIKKNELATKLLEKFTEMHEYIR